MVFPALKIGNLVSRLPIVQGGMGVGISLSGLASAVANEGGIGVIATPMIGIGEPDVATNCLEANNRVLRREIHRARELSRGIIGVNIMVALTNFADMVKTAIEEKVNVIFSGAGLPLNLPGFLKNGAGPKLVPIVSSARAARIICKKWLTRYDYLPDAFVVEGPMAGGHLGFSPAQIDDPAFALENLVCEVIEAVRPFGADRRQSVPVLAAGGVYSGADILKYIRMGAAGVQMGTRFVATHECDADPAFKEAFVQARAEDLTIIRSPVGMPGRAIRNSFIEAFSNGGRKRFNCVYHCITTCSSKDSPYCIAMALLNAKQGKLKHGFAFAGANAFRVDKILSVRELIASLQVEFDQASA